MHAISLLNKQQQQQQNTKYFCLKKKKVITPSLNYFCKRYKKKLCILCQNQLALYVGVWRMAWQPNPVFLPGESMGREAWQATVNGSQKSRTQLSNLACRGRSTLRDPICSSFVCCFSSTLYSLLVPGKQERAELHAVLRTEIMRKGTCLDSLQWPFT